MKKAYGSVMTTSIFPMPLRGGLKSRAVNTRNKKKN